jgi:hypothetical protein
VEDLEKILATDEAAEYPELGLADSEWTQAIKVSCMAMEICDDSNKAEWQPCAYSNYRWAMEQEQTSLCLLRRPRRR